jgi:anhydro-N-acetylmuramic acid kinase
MGKMRVVILGATVGCAVLAGLLAKGMIGRKPATEVVEINRVPMADVLLFASADAPRVLLNLGGMANLTYLPAGGGLDAVLAFDTGPGNAVMDALAAARSGGAATQDRDGASAARGRASREVLAELLAEAFFSRPPPRSTGRERFGEAYAAAMWSRGKALGLSDDDIMATALELTALSIADAITRFVRPRGAVDRVVASGGGVRNPTLMRALAERLAPIPIEPADALGVPADGKEALAFAFLAHQTLSGLPGNVPGATGAAHAAVLGHITPGGSR